MTSSVGVNNGKWDGAYDKALKLQARTAASQGLPAGYTVHVSNTHNRVFYKETSTGKTTWVRPTRPSDAAAAAIAAAVGGGNGNVARPAVTDTRKGEGEEEGEEEEGELRASTPPVPGLQAEEEESSGPASTRPLGVEGLYPVAGDLADSAATLEGAEVGVNDGAKNGMGSDSLLFFDVGGATPSKGYGIQSSSKNRPRRSLPQYPPSSSVSPCSADLSGTSTEKAEGGESSCATDTSGIALFGGGKKGFDGSASVSCVDASAVFDGRGARVHQIGVMQIQGGSCKGVVALDGAIGGLKAPSVAGGGWGAVVRKPTCATVAATGVLFGVWATMAVCVAASWGALDGQDAFGGECPYGPRLWPWAMVMSISMALTCALSFASSSTRRRDGAALFSSPLVERLAIGVLSVFIAAWLIVGMVWVYGDYASASCPTNLTASPPSSYAASLAVMILSYITVACVAIAGACVASAGGGGCVCDEEQEGGRHLLVEAEALASARSRSSTGSDGTRGTPGKVRTFD